MNHVFTPARLFILGFVLLMAVNAIVLLGVWTNRSGKTEAVLELTERELALPYIINDENSGLALRLEWRILPESGDDTYQTYNSWGHWGSPVWFNEQKLKELGFKIDIFTCPDEKSKRRKEPLPKDVYIVLEYDGAAYREALKRAEVYMEKAEAAIQANKNEESVQNRFKEAQKILKAEGDYRSRLFAIDAGLDAAILREHYTDRSKFSIVPGIVRLECRYDKDKKVVMGSISDIRVDKINVPLSYRKPLYSTLAKDRSRKDDLSGIRNKLTFYSRGENEPRYKVHLAYGSRFEPWIQVIEKLGK